MKFKKIAALCSCLSMVGSLMCPMTVGADGMEPETALYEEVQTEEAASGAESENATESSQETEREETEKPETEKPETQGEQPPPTEKTESESGPEQGTEAGSETDTETVTESGTEPGSEPGTENGTEDITENVTEEPTEQPVTENMTDETTEGTTEEGSESGTETELPSETETESSFEVETESEHETESETETKTEADSTEETVPSRGYGYEASSNYFWDPSWYISPDFRFTQVDKKYAIVESEQDLICVYDSDSGEGKVIGRIPYFGLVFVLEEGEEWSYIESGMVRGFIQTSTLKTGDYAEQMMQCLGEYNFKSGISEVAAYENKAFTHTHTTTKEVVATKQYGIALFSCEIHEYPVKTSRAIG